MPSWRDPSRPTAHDRFRSIFRNHWHVWSDLRLVREVPPDQQAYAQKTIERMILCRDASAGYARYICPGCGFDRRVPFSCKTRFCPSCGKVKVDNWVADIARDLYDVPHLHVTLTIDNLLSVDMVLADGRLTTTVFFWVGVSSPVSSSSIVTG